MTFGSRIATKSVLGSMRTRIRKAWKWRARAQVHRKLLSAQYTAAVRDSLYDSVVNDVSCGWCPGKGRVLYAHDLSNP
eukprot:9540436-Lingulodinium_polyedra.AAC.1